ncbi:MAG: hypothetical protein HYX80_02470 [Chloroflexi bacterium]|nr:hypothetical protein [Chloroflexota bacterium]
MKPQTENVKGFQTGKPTPKQRAAWAKLWRKLLTEPQNKGENAGQPPTAGAK